MSDADERQNRQAILDLGVMARAIFLGVATEAQRSIVEGSELTGAPGQPVDVGYLKGSWSPPVIDGSTATIGTNAEYAEAIEDGIGKYGPLTLRSQVGGFHSVALTIAGMDRIVEHVTNEVAKRPS
jgi:hypothetical protein